MKFKELAIVSTASIIQRLKLTIATRPGLEKAGGGAVCKII
jgi:hypothetical protein